MSIFFLSYSVFRKHLLQTRKNKGLFGQGLNVMVPVFQREKKIRLLMAFSIFSTMFSEAFPGLFGFCGIDLTCFLQLSLLVVASLGKDWTA